MNKLTKQNFVFFYKKSIYLLVVTMCFFGLFNLTEVSANTVILSDDYGYNSYSVSGLSDNTTIDATNASWIQDNDDTDGASSPYPFLVYDSPNVTIQGGRILGNIEQTNATTWRDVYDLGNSAAIRVEGSSNAVIKDWTITDTWDAIRVSWDTPNFLIENVMVTNGRDDAIENDKLNSGTIRNCLFDGMFAGISLDPSSSSPVDGSEETVTIEGVLLRMQPSLYSGEINHSSLIKTDSATNGAVTPQLRFINNVFAIENVEHRSYRSMFNAWEHTIESSGNMYLNLSDEPLPDDYPVPPAGWTILEGQAARDYWEQAKSDWIANRGTETPPSPSDTDGDTIPDTTDNCPTTSNADQADADNDGIGDVCDSTPNGDVTSKFDLGEQVQTTDNLNVRLSAGLSGSLIGQQVVGAIGVVIDAMAKFVDNYTWIQIDFDSGADGWVAEEFLASYASPTSIPGCTDSTATNYNPEATTDDGSCEYPPSDNDSDGVPDTTDNCPTTSNADQADADNDGIGDVCDSTPNGDETPSDDSGLITKQVSYDEDDAEEETPSGDMDISSSDLEMIEEKRDNQLVGLRFRNVQISRGSKINDALLKFTVDETDSGSTNLTFHGQDIGNAPAFTTTDFDISSRNKTSAQVNWSNVPAWSKRGASNEDQTTPNISSVLQEIVNRSDWQSGNDLVIIISGDGQRVAEAYDGDKEAAPILQIAFGDTYIEDNETETDEGDDTEVVTDPDDETDEPVIDSTIINISSIVSQDEDDAEEETPSGDMDISSSDLELVHEKGDDQVVGIRYRNLEIPNGATIKAASVKFTIDEVTSEQTNLTFHGQDIGNAPAFTTTDFDISSRNKTSAQVNWSNVPVWSDTGLSGDSQTTPDISSVIQEIVNRSDWQSGNDLAIIISGNGQRVAEAYDGEADLAPVLNLSYTNGSVQGIKSNTMDSKFINSQAVVKQTVNVREGAGLSASKLGTRSVGDVGRVVSGPITIDGWDWFGVEFDYGVSGWIAGEYID